MKHNFTISISQTSEIEKERIKEILERIGTSLCKNTISGEYRFVSLENIRGSSNVKERTIEVSFDLDDYLAKAQSYQDLLEQSISTDKKSETTEKPKKGKEKIPKTIQRGQIQNYAQIVVKGKEPNKKGPFYNRFNEIFQKLKFGTFVETIYNGIIVIFKSKSDFQNSVEILEQAKGMRKKEKIPH